MARAQALDYLNNMRFHVRAVDNTIQGLIGAPTNNSPQAGFSACTTPEATVETVEYKEGQFLYTRKYPGHTTFNDVTLSRGIARKDTTFWKWIQMVIEGTKGEYRTELEILHFHRVDTMPGVTAPPAENILLDVPAKIYRLWQSLPVRHKFSSDLDATDSAVSIAELDIAYEHCEEVEPS